MVCVSAIRAIFIFSYFHRFTFSTWKFIYACVWSGGTMAKLLSQETVWFYIVIETILGFVRLFRVMRNNCEEKLNSPIKNLVKTSKQHLTHLGNDAWMKIAKHSHPSQWKMCNKENEVYDKCANFNPNSDWVTFANSSDCILYHPVFGYFVHVRFWKFCPIFTTLNAIYLFFMNATQLCPFCRMYRRRDAIIFIHSAKSFTLLKWLENQSFIPCFRWRLWNSLKV